MVRIQRNMIIPVVGLYILFFNPNTVFTGSFLTKFLYPILFIGTIFQTNQYKQLLTKEYQIVIITLILLIYNIVLGIIYKLDSEVLKGVLNLSLGIFLIPTFAIYLKNKFSLNQIIFLIILTGYIACFCTVFLFLFPDINILFRQLQFKGNDTLMDIMYRGFGWSNGLFFYYPIILGLILIIIFQTNYSLNFKILSAILFGFAICVNARIGLVPIIVWIVYRSFKSVKFICITTMSVVVIILALVLLGNVYDGTLTGFMIKWILGGVGQILNPLIGTTFDTLGENHIDTLTNRMIFLPEFLELILFGTGENIYIGVGGQHSDSGYVVQLFYGGVVTLLLLFWLTLLMVYQLYRRTKVEYRCGMSIIFLATIYISNMKGDFYFQMNNGFFFFYFIFLIISIYNENKSCTVDNYSCV